MLKNIWLHNILLGAASVELFPSHSEVKHQMIRFQVENKLIKSEIHGYNTMFMGQWLFFLIMMCSLTMILLGVVFYPEKVILHAVLLTLYVFCAFFPKVFLYYAVKDFLAKTKGDKNVSKT